MLELWNLENKFEAMHPMFTQLTEYFGEISRKHGSGFLEGEPTWDDKDIQDAASLLTAFAIKHDCSFEEMKQLFERIDANFDSEDLGVFALAQMATAVF